MSSVAGSQITTYDADSKISDVEQGHAKRNEIKLPERPKGVRTVGIFNAEDFLYRAQTNEKISNILRSPTKHQLAPNGIRQRSVYTNFNPFSTQSEYSLGHSTSSAALALERNNFSSLTIPSTSVSAGALGSKESSSQTAGNQVSAFITKHSNMGNATHLAPPFETTISARPTAPQSIFNGRLGLPPSGGYPYDTNGSYRMPALPLSQQYQTPMPTRPYAMNPLNARISEYELLAARSFHGLGPIAMSNGTLQLHLRDGIRVDMTLDKAVRVLNQRSMVAMALSRNYGNTAIIHPNGRILQNSTKVEIVTYDGMKSNNYVRYAKMWYKGVSFTSESCALIYLVDSAGTRTTTDTFTDLTKDYTLTVFYDESRHGPGYVQDINDIIKKSTYACNEDGTEIYDLNGFRITQAPDGLIKITRNHNKCLIRTSPNNGSATLTTPGIHCTASLGKTSHLFVRRNEKRMHFDGSCFIVRNAGHSAGFNENNLLIVY